LPSELKNPESLDEFPHNPFGHRLRVVGQQLKKAGQPNDLPARLQRVAREDSDADGVANQTELLLGHRPGDPKDLPAKSELKQLKQRRAEFARFQASYQWKPFQSVQRPAVPKPKDPAWRRNPIDAFLAAEHEARGLTARPEASKEILLRRLYLDLIGLTPTPAEQSAFAQDDSPEAYEKVVDRLLSNPRYGERWARHWMDVWRYSDWAGWTDGGQVRDSKPHIWRWRDWIVESLNRDKGYDRMLVEMLAADELAPEDPDALRATGFLARNFKMLSREQWLEDTLKHTSQAFLGLTLGCAKCHQHMYDPISQREYYELRACFEPHQVRTDRVPGQTDTSKDGLVRVFDTDTNAPTYFYPRGDERKPDTNRVMTPGVPKLLGGTLRIAPVQLPRLAAHPDKRDFVIRDAVAASERAVTEARQAFEKIKADANTKPEKTIEAELNVALAQARHTALLIVIEVEKLEDESRKDTEEWQQAATRAVTLQREQARAETKLKLHQARVAEAEAKAKAEETAKAFELANKESKDKEPADKIEAKKKASEKAAKELEGASKKTAEAEKALADAEKEQQAAPTTAYKPRSKETYPVASTGRRLAFARWLAHRDNPLTARVAVNHIWLRHFGQAIVPSVSDFGANGRPPTHPQLLDWLAAHFMEEGWRMKALHRLIVTSRAYRMASTPCEANARIDQDNLYLWRMPSRRLEAELVRDNLLWCSGNLDPTLGGPEIDHKLGLTSKRRSLYLRIAAEKEVEFLKIFDGPSVTECYERKPTVMPQQALALANSELALGQARELARHLASEPAVRAATSVREAKADEAFVQAAFRRILARAATAEEVRLCLDFLTERTRHLTGNLPSKEAAPPEKSGEASNLRVNPAQRAREHLVLVLFNHSDFVTVR
jgi:hypothetical protein